MKPLISIIVPVYNAGQYLADCIDSILSQTYKNLEIILVDDGSTDQSPIICDQYQALDSRITALHQPNSGPTRARKAGLEIASGTYVGFVDSDDWIEPDMYETLVHYMETTCAHIVTSGYFKETGTQTLIIKDPISPGVYKEECELEDFFQNMIFYGDFHHRGINIHLVTKLYRKEVIEDSFKNLDDSICHGEDLFGVYASLVRSPAICVTGHVFYHYRFVAHSLSHVANEQYLEKINTLYLGLKKQFTASSFSKVLLKQLDYLMVDLVLRGLHSALGLSKSSALPYYIFPFNRIRSNCHMILYGAGSVGQCYYQQLQLCGNCHVNLWVDQNYHYYEQKGYPVHGVDRILTAQFDCILIAVKYEDMAKEIKESLTAAGVQPDKILWFEPGTIMDYLIPKE